MHIDLSTTVRSSVSPSLAGCVACSIADHLLTDQHPLTNTRLSIPPSLYMRWPVAVDLLQIIHKFFHSCLG